MQVLQQLHGDTITGTHSGYNFTVTVDENGNPVVTTTKSVTPGTNNYGYNESENCFIGQKSTGKLNDVDNTQTANWDSSKNGYKFTAGHFIHITNYSGLLWDETENGFVQKTNADVYLCWDGDYGEITSQQDLIDYAVNNSTSTYWDIFDASSGTWLNYEGGSGQ